VIRGAVVVVHLCVVLFLQSGVLNLPMMAKDGVPAYRGIRSTGISLCRPEALAIFFSQHAKDGQGWCASLQRHSEYWNIFVQAGGSRNFFSEFNTH